MPDDLPLQSWVFSGVFCPNYVEEPEGITKSIPILMLYYQSWDLFGFGEFHSHGGTPVAGWFISGKIPIQNG